MRILFSAAQVFHAELALVARHLQGAVDQLGHFVDLVRIDDDGLLHRLASPGEGRQDQDAWLLDLTRDELFGHQIHSVPQRRHHGDGCVPVKRRQLILFPQQQQQRYRKAIANKDLMPILKESSTIYHLRVNR